MIVHPKMKRKKKKEKKRKRKIPTGLANTLYYKHISEAL